MKSKHPQAPPFSNNEEIERFLAKPNLARFGSFNEDGTIHIAPLYFLYDHGEFLLGTQTTSRKVRNIQRDNRATILIDQVEPIMQSVLVYGNAILDYEDLVAKRVKIIERYFESSTAAKSFVERLTKSWETVIIRVRPSQIVSVDYSKPFSID
jgi:general stress protein 26